MRTVICEQGMEFNRWCTAPGNSEAYKRKPGCVALWPIVARNADRARRRRQRVGLSPLSNESGPARLSDSTMLEVPSAGQVVPNVSCSALLPHPHFPTTDSDTEGEEGEASGVPPANPARPKRAVDELGAPERMHAE